MCKGAGLMEAPVSFLELSAVGTCELTQDFGSGNGEPRWPTHVLEGIEANEAFPAYEVVLCEGTEIKAAESFSWPKMQTLAR